VQHTTSADGTRIVLVAATDRLVDLIPHAQLVVVPESHDHRVDPAGTVREMRSRLTAPDLYGP
jgi:hypothetical protein